MISLKKHFTIEILDCVKDLLEEKGIYASSDDLEGGGERSKYYELEQNIENLLEEFEKEVKSTCMLFY